MDALLKDAILKLSTQQEEILTQLTVISETITKQRTDALLDRIAKLEQSMKEQHVKLDALNSIDINPTIEAPRPATVRVAGGKKKAEEEDKKEKKADADEDKAKEEDAEDPLSFSGGNITEYFKFLWIRHREIIYEKAIYSEKEYEKLLVDNKDEFDKKKKNELVLQKAIAYKIWRGLAKDKQEVVRAMKNQNANDLNKKASKDIEAEDEE